MKILFFGPKKHKGLIGGVVTHSEVVLQGLRELYPDASIDVFDTSYGYGGRRLSIYDSLIRILARDYGGYDLVYINISLYFSSILKLVIILGKLNKTFKASGKNAKVVVQFHGGDMKKLKKTKRFILYLLLKDKLGVVSKLRFLTNEQKRQFEVIFGIGEPFTEKVRNLVDVKDEVEIDNFEKLRVLLLSRLDYGKGIEEYIECAKLMKDDSRVKFYAAGDGILKNKLKKAAYELQNFVYLGSVDNKQRDEVIKNCNVFCLISEAEGMPYALLENMATGNIPIVTGRGAMGEIVLDYSAGLIIPKSATALRDALNQLLADPSFAKMLSGCAYGAMKKHYSLEKLRSSLEALV